MDFRYPLMLTYDRVHTTSYVFQHFRPVLALLGRRLSLFSFVLFVLSARRREPQARQYTITLYPHCTLLLSDDKEIEK